MTATDPPRRRPHGLAVFGVDLMDRPRSRSSIATRKPRDLRNASTRPWLPLDLGVPVHAALLVSASPIGINDARVRLAHLITGQMPAILDTVTSMFSDSSHGFSQVGGA